MGGVHAELLQPGGAGRRAHCAKRQLRRIDPGAARDLCELAGARHARPHDDEEGMTVRTLRSTVVAEGLTYGEGPRWRDGKLWFSDMHADAIRTLDAGGELDVGAHANHPSGIGWTPEGDLLVTS